MPKFLALVLAAVLAPNVLAQDLSDATYTKIGDDQIIVYPLPDDILTEYDRRITMDDGVEISMNIYRPNTPEKVPVVICFTSYDKDMWPNKWVTTHRGNPFRALGAGIGSMTVSDEANWEASDPGFWVPNGYALILVDARGSGKSTGKKDVFSTRTQKDFAKAVEWASEQPWSTGKVGTQGTSYLGIIQWYVNAHRPKGLAAMSVWEGLTDVVRDVAFKGGIPETAFVPWWMGIGHSAPIDPSAETQFGMTDLPKVPTMEFYTDQEILPTNVGNINVPALVVSTWSTQGLHSRGGFEGYKRLQNDKYLYTHGGHEWTVSNSDDALEYQKAFFDYYLKGDESAIDKLMKVRLEVLKGDGESYVREEKAWPVANTNYRKLYLDGYNAKLAGDAPPFNTMTQYTSTDLNDEITFTYTFDEDTEIVGYSKLKLWVSTTHGNDMDLFVGIRKINEDGKAMQFMNRRLPNTIATRGWLRVSMRKLHEEFASDIQPVLALDEYQPIEANEIVPVEIEILPLAVLFEKGTTLELVVKGSDIAKEPTVQHDKLVNIGFHKIFAGKDYDSHLVLPIVN